MRLIKENIPKKIGPGEAKHLNLPDPKSHKGENGRLLIIAGSEKYHGSLLYAIKTAAKIVDLIYVLTTKGNEKLVRKLKSRTAEFIPVAKFSTDYNCILIGPGMGVLGRTYKLVEAVLKSKVKAVLDADAINVLDKNLARHANKNVILTPHRKELKHIFEVDDKFTISHNCTIVIKGKVDIVASPDRKPAENYTGNEGMTKGGTGDVLAGLIAAFFCKNDAYTSAAAGVYINGKAGDELHKKVGPYYNAEDLLEQIPKTLWKLVK